MGCFNNSDLVYIPPVSNQVVSDGLLEGLLSGFGDCCDRLASAPSFDFTFLSMRHADHLDYRNTFDQLTAFIKYLSNNAIKNIVHLGIGGSILGPELLYDVCASYLKPAFSCYFFSSFDPQLQLLLEEVDFSETVFLVVSKSFITDEVFWQWNQVKRFAKSCQKPLHAFAITSQVALAKEKGFGPKEILAIPPEVGGRFSVWSVVSASIAAAFGLEIFRDFLAGAASMDEALADCDDSRNPARQMAVNALSDVMVKQKSSRVLLAYHAQLQKLVSYVQQLEMESLGKQLDKDGNKVEGWLAPVIWGGVGTSMQHSVFQSILQGGLGCPLDFIIVKGDSSHLIRYKAHCDAQIMVLEQGFKADRVEEAIEPNTNFQVIELEGLAARSLGSLIALYEHKILWLASLLNMDPFTQLGVQAAKAALETRED
jgi:glucose-6-phosphate isomerase